MQQSVFSLFFNIINKIYKLIKFFLEYIYFLLQPSTILNYETNIQTLIKVNDRETQAKHFNCIFSNLFTEKIAQADKIVEHIFDLLGSNDTQLSQIGKGYQPLKWHEDFKSGYRWNKNIFFRFIRYGNKRGVDIKVPWELSRFQHLTLLGQAYLLTTDIKYVDEFQNQILDWIENNRVGFGVNWVCTMDVAIRAANWLVAIEHFIDADHISDRFLKQFYASLYDHAKFIYHHLENNAITTNHYLANIAGLLFISIYCPFFKESKKWKEFCINELEQEIKKQVYDDGCSFEASTSYHRLALELFFYSALIAQRAGMHLSTIYHEKLKKMFEFSLYCIKPNGTIPQIGDNDSGRFLIFSKRPVLNHTYLLSLASIYFKSSDFKLKNSTYEEEALWIFGKQGYELWNEIECRKTELESKVFPNAGWYIMRHKKDYCFITCGSNGQNGNGGHSHNDKLSFELMLDGHDIIVDPGTYVYTPFPIERNKFRSTAYHNTVQFNDTEQNIFSNNLFFLGDKVRLIDAKFFETADILSFEGEICYLNFTHVRRVLVSKKRVEVQIKDKLLSAKPAHANLTLHLSPQVKTRDNVLFVNETEDAIATITIEGSSFRRANYDYSPEYGNKIRAERLVATIPYFKQIEITTFIQRL